MTNVTVSERATRIAAMLADVPVKGLTVGSKPYVVLHALDRDAIVDLLASIPALEAEIREECAAGETIESMIAWGDETFGPCDPARAVSRAEEEWREMDGEVPGTMDHAIEAADVIICLLRIPLIRDALNQKMAKNRSRKWKLMGDGTGYHIKAEAIRQKGQP